MKVSAGELKGRKICRRAVGTDSKHGVLRATSSKVRESIFNILGDRVRDSVFVDLYAGTGAVGTEAMSRGAKRVYFVEAERKRVEGIEELLGGCGCRDRAVILKSKADIFIKKMQGKDDDIDVIFLDPPYGSDEIENILPIIGKSESLADSAVVIAEHSVKLVLPDNPGNLRKVKIYKYGDTALTLYRRD